LYPCVWASLVHTLTQVSLKYTLAATILSLLRKSVMILLASFIVSSASLFDDARGAQHILAIDEDTRSEASSWKNV